MKIMHNNGNGSSSRVWTAIGVWVLTTLVAIIGYFLDQRLSSMERNQDVWTEKINKVVENLYGMDKRVYSLEEWREFLKEQNKRD